MSPKKQLYFDVKKIVLEKTAIEHFAMFNSQFDNMEEEDTFLFPCCFMEFIEINYTTKAKGLQEGAFTFRLHFGFESLDDEQLEMFDITDDAHQNLQGIFKENLYSGFERVFESQDVNHDNVKVWVVDYKTTLTDNTGNLKGRQELTKINSIEIKIDPQEPRLNQI